MIEPFKGRYPILKEDVYVAAAAAVIGDVELGRGSSVWPGAVVRGDCCGIRIGELSNIQDGCICHTTTGGPPLVLGCRVTVGHGAVLHSCTVEDGCLIGMGAVIMDGVKVGAGSIVAAGCVIPQSTQIPPRSLVLGVPGAVKRRLDEETVSNISRRAEEYHRLAMEYLG